MIGGRGMHSVVEHLPRMHEVLASMSSTPPQEIMFCLLPGEVGNGKRLSPKSYCTNLKAITLEPPIKMAHDAAIDVGKQGASALSTVWRGVW